jgi:hypothetical protein
MSVIEPVASDKERYTKILQKAISETFENLIFSEPEFDETVARENGEYLYIDMETPLRARLLGRVSRALSAEIASTVLSIEPEHLSDVILNDAVGEVLNTVAGAFLRDLLPDGEKFNLGLPGKTDSQESPTHEFCHVFGKVNDEPVHFCLAWGFEPSFSGGEEDSSDINGN